MSLLGLIVVRKVLRMGTSQSFATSSLRSPFLPTFLSLSFYDSSSTLREANESVRLMQHDSKLTHPHWKAT